MQTVKKDIDKFMQLLNAMSEHELKELRNLINESELKKVITRIIKFLGYCPTPIDESTLGGRIYEYRLYNGLSYAGMGRLLGVDATTIAGWKRNEHFSYGERLKKLNELLRENKNRFFSKGKEPV